MRIRSGNSSFRSFLFRQILSSPRKSSELPAFRMRPYFLPERSRTKSESLDLASSMPDTNSGDTLLNLYPMFTTGTTNSASYSTMSSTLMDTSVAGTSRSPGILMPQYTFGFDISTVSAAPRVERRARLKQITGMKKSKSLEDVRTEANVDGSQLSHEMEFVSSRIQKLKVQEPE